MQVKYTGEARVTVKWIDKEELTLLLRVRKVDITVALILLTRASPASLWSNDCPFDESRCVTQQPLST
jgi:hypothetical protein